MNNLTDQQLLRDYCGRRSEAAFAELVRRHVDFAYSAALRMVRDEHLAKDVTQEVFMALVKNANQLVERPVLFGWLHRTAQNIAANVVRAEVRRRTREEEAMKGLFSGDSAVEWEHVSPHLDAALNELREEDREALFLRYFANKSLREVGATLGTSERAAQKRVSRAIERLRLFFASKGVTVSASGIAALISANSVQSASAGLAATITAATTLGATAITTVKTATVIQTIVMTTIQKTLIATALIAAVGAGLYEARLASNLRGQVETLQQQLTPLTDQVRQLQRERDEATNRVAALADAMNKDKVDAKELLKLRGLVAARGREQPSNPQTAQTAPDGPDDPNFDVTINAKLNRLKEKISLSADQETSLRKLLREQQTKSDELLKLFQNSAPDSTVLAQMIQRNEQSETEVMSLLTPEQQAAYVQMRQQDWRVSAQASAKGELTRLQQIINLTPEQQNLILPVLNQQLLKEKMRREGGNALVPDGDGTSPQSVGEALKQSVDQRLQALSTILTPEQLEKYRESLDAQRNRVLSMLPGGGAAGN